MWLFIGQSIWFFLPAGIANLFASLSRHFHLSNYPVDFNKTWRGKRIFGSHKTWRGIIVGGIFGILFFWLQQYLYQFSFFKEISLVNYEEQSFVFGLLLGLGAVLGDLIRSFFKRRFNINPGYPWLPFDQIDYTIGSLIAISFIYFPGWPVVLFIVFFGFFLHILINLLGYLLRLQKNKL